MREKVGWMFLWTTLAFWVGCAAAPGPGEQHVTPHAEAPAETAFAQVPAPAPADADAAGPRLEGDDAAAAEPADTADVAAAPAHLGPGVDRRHWGRIIVAPERGQVAHWPVYYTRHDDRMPRFTEDRLSPLREEPAMAMEAEADAALQADAHLYGHMQPVDTLIGPFQFAFDTLALPVRLVRTPPWQVQHTPER